VHFTKTKWWSPGPFTIPTCQLNSKNTCLMLKALTLLTSQVPLGNMIRTFWPGEHFGPSFSLTILPNHVTWQPGQYLWPRENVCSWCYNINAPSNWGKYSQPLQTCPWGKQTSSWDKGFVRMSSNFSSVEMYWSLTTPFSAMFWYLISMCFDLSSRSYPTTGWTFLWVASEDALLHNSPTSCNMLGVEPDYLLYSKVPPH